jgi:LPS sulfotransferase NodH
VNTAASPTALGPEGVVRFLVVCGARTGSNMLCSALNSHPRIVCFREVYNFLYPESIDYHVDGYHPRDPEDLALRERDPIAYARTRLFAQDPAETSAAGFKYMYDHVWGYPGLLEALQADTDIRIIHLMRRNGVRAFLSYKIAFETGEWQRPRRRPFLTRLGFALGHPIEAARDQARKMRGKLTPVDRRIHLDPDECVAYMRTREEQHAHFRDVFAGHPFRDVWYEDILADRERHLAEVQAFLGVATQALREEVERQNPGTLRELVRNYDELAKALSGTEYETMFRGA